MPMYDSSDVLSWPPLGDYCLLDTPDARVRLAATTTMAATLANEVNQPLAAAANYMHACASRLRSRGEGFEELLLMIGHASNEMLKVGEIIRRARSFIVSGKIASRRENLRTMAERVVAALEAAGPVEIEIVRTIPLTDFVMGDRIQIEQILSNLLRNACEALEDRALRRIVIESEHAGDDIVVRIRDSGPGLPDAMLDDPFAPRFAPGARGRGLGLAICRTIVAAHGGRIWAENMAEGGAAISFALPAADQPCERLCG